MPSAMRCASRSAPRPSGWRPSTAPMPSAPMPRARPTPTRSARWRSRLRYEIEAEGMRLMNEAQNMLTPESRAARPCGCGCSTSSRASSAKASGRWRRSTASRSCMSTGCGGGNARPGAEGSGEFRRQHGQHRAALPRPGAAGRFAAEGDGARAGTDLTKLGK